MNRWRALLSTTLVVGILALLLSSPSAQALPSDLFFSEYVEGSSNNKALEIFNGTGMAIDLSFYGVSIFSNGNTTANTQISLLGILANNSVFVLADNDAAAAILNVADQTTGASLYNGDDAVALLNNGTFIDVIGQIGVDPGSQWGSGSTSTQNHTLRRKTSILTGDPDGTNPFDPVIEWDGFPVDTFDGLGTYQGPISSQSVSEPRTILLLGSGLIGYGIWRRFKK